MYTRIRFMLLMALCALTVGALAIHAQEDQEAKPRERFTKEQKGVAEYVVGQLDGEQQMLLNGLRYLMRPRYEDRVMDGLAFSPCPLPSFDDEVDHEMNLAESMRLWAILRSGWEYDANLQRELGRFMKTEHKRYNDSLAAYAVPLAVCTSALRRDEIKRNRELAETLLETAEDLMELGMKLRDLTDEESPNINGMVIQPAWYANHLWRTLMGRCALELEIDFNERVWESDLKNLSHAAQKELGWISTQGKGMTPDNDLNSNLLALAAVSLALSAPEKAVDKNVRRSLDKRLKYLKEILSRLEQDWPRELRTGGRLCLVRTFDPEFGPDGVESFDWRLGIREEAVENMYASGAVYTDHTLVREMGLHGGTNGRYAQDACETALACLSLCGGLYPDREKEAVLPLEGSNSEDLKLTMESLSLLHASLLPELSDIESDLIPRVNEAIDKGAAFLADYQANNGHFQNNRKDSEGSGHPAYTAGALHALMHAGYAYDDEIIEQGMTWLRDCINEITANNAFVMMSYDAGIILMMYGRYYEWLAEENLVFDTEGQAAAKRARQNTWNKIPQVDKDIITKLVRFLDDCHLELPQGGWGYNSFKGKELNGRIPHTDNSISQFAACGYKAASLLGAPVDMKVFETEARRLSDQYSSNRDMKAQAFKRYAENEVTDADERYVSGKYADRKIWDRVIHPGGWSYHCSGPHPTGSVKGPHGTVVGPQYTGTGMAILAAAKDELWANGMLGDGLRRMIDVKMFGAQLWLASQEYWEVESHDPLPLPDPEADDEEEDKHIRGGRVSPSSIYTWYAIERGCVMAGYDIIGGNVNWYQNIARWLVDMQHEDGQWGDILQTAWAILILRRAAPRCVTRPPVPKVGEGDPVITPSPVTDRQKFPTTPGPVKPEKDHAGDPPEEEDEPVSPVTPGPGD